MSLIQDLRKRIFGKQDDSHAEVTIVDCSKVTVTKDEDASTNDSDSQVAPDSPSDAIGGFPSEGEMTGTEASALLDVVSEAQTDPAGKPASDDLLPADDSVPDEYGNLMGVREGDDGEDYAVYDMGARAGMEVVEVPQDGQADDDEEGETNQQEEDAEEHAEEHAGDEPAGENGDGQTKEPQTEDASPETMVTVTFRDGENIEPLGFDAPFKAEHAVGEMMTDWHLRLVYDHDMPSGDDEPIVELYDGETGDFVSDYWVSQFCDNSDEREGQGLACKGAEKRFRIMYEDLVGMQELVRPVDGVSAWYVAHEGDMPDHDI